MRNREMIEMAVLKSKSSTMMDSYRQLRNRVNTLNIQLTKQTFQIRTVTFALSVNILPAKLRIFSIPF